MRTWDEIRELLRAVDAYPNFKESDAVDIWEEAMADPDLEPIFGPAQEDSALETLALLYADRDMQEIIDGLANDIAGRSFGRRDQS